VSILSCPRTLYFWLGEAFVLGRLDVGELGIAIFRGLLTHGGFCPGDLCPPRRHPINSRVLSHHAAPMQMENRRVFKLIVFARRSFARALVAAERNNNNWQLLQSVAAVCDSKTRS